MATYIISADNSISPRVAFAALQDSDTLRDGAVIVMEEETDWAAVLVSDLGLETTETRPYYTSVDTLVGPPDETYVRLATEAGSQYLDISSGLVAITLVDDEDVQESPDTEVLPEPKAAPKAPRKAPAKKAAAKKAAREPLPKIPPAAEERVTQETVERHKPVVSEEPVRPAQTPSAPVATPETDRTSLLHQLVVSMLQDASEETLWSVAETLRSSR